MKSPPGFQCFRKSRYPSGRSDVVLSRWITLGWGAFGTLLACYVDRLGMIIEQTQILAGLVGVGLGGIVFRAFLPNAPTPPAPSPAMSSVRRPQHL